ncbi:MAG: NADH-quinone oxidoreductase subunit M, partial [Deltaproteobacteria bacterium]|nr:NADH-quinone oxidoreductase subunit M [Deltaproteobacteria bacterium]
MPYLLLQIVGLPLVAAVVTGFTRNVRKSHLPGWITITTLVYTTLLLGFAGIRVCGGEVLLEQYFIGPEVSLNLLADGLSLPMALIINLICLALAVYSLHYVEHRIELIYG